MSLSLARTSTEHAHCSSVTARPTVQSRAATVVADVPDLLPHRKRQARREEQQGTMRQYHSIPPLAVVCAASGHAAWCIVSTKVCNLPCGGKEPRLSFLIVLTSATAYSPSLLPDIHQAQHPSKFSYQAQHWPCLARRDVKRTAQC